MRQTRWGIVGPGAIAHNFADGLKESTSGRLAAIASRDAARRTAFGDAYGIDARRRHPTYEALILDADVDAVYISTPHPWHAELSIAALRAGKAVLVEKPAGLNAAEVLAVTEVAAQEKRFFMEAFMYRMHPQIAAVLAVLRSGEIGDVLHIRTAFGFHAEPSPGSRLYEHGLAGGGILDVGGYPVSLTRLIAGVAEGKGFADPVVVKGTGILGETGVDEVAYGTLRFASGVTAEVACAVRRAMDNSATIHGTKGRIVIADPWVPGRNAGPSDASFTVTVGDTTRTEWVRDPRILFAFEAEAVSRWIAEGRLEAEGPAPTHLDSIGNNATLAAWRAEVGYRTLADRPATSRPIKALLPRGLPPIPEGRLPGLDRAVSRLVLGCDNKADLASGAPLWDAFAEAGGNAFDTAFVYGGGAHEKALGDWIAARGVAKDITVIAKGAHTPFCFPDAIAPQLDQSLARLGLDRAPVYILHRDNPEVPVGEFVTALNTLVAAGRIGIFGGSNWSPARIAEANAWASANGLQGFAILNNNLSLATMERPVWPGCISSNTPETLAFLKGAGLAHLSWSAQARGYFLPEALRNRLPPDTAPETCFGGSENAERRRRAEEIAAKRGVSAHNVALAWVLAQPFPSFALIGARTAGEVATTLPALGVELSAAEVAWLNLELNTIS